MRISFRYVFLIIVFLFAFKGFSQDSIKKSLNIIKVIKAPKIDGILNDEAWQNAEVANNFTQFRPEMGIKETPEKRTEVKVTYNDEAIFIAAYLFDKPDEIMRQFTNRDNFGQSDFFGITLNPNNDAQNDIKFFVFSSGTQADAIASPSIGEDYGWDAVWDSKVKLVEDGWIVEIKIPYSALRFSNQKVQTWGVQFQRRFRATNLQYSWSPIDRTKGYTGLYHGELTGINNIKPPTRLSFYPFASGIVSSFDGATNSEFNVGLDLKYGISENFTLDATLIPDFSQAGFDEVRLNLGPFEQAFSEQRQFFKEGVDLFNKGGLFYSRRIGSGPTGGVDLDENEELTNYPDKVNMLNAIKLSGRTKKGLGIGIFDAITETTEATILDTINGTERRQVVEPFANYNIIVLDQQFNRNSSISLINTNVMREGHFRDANVTGLLLDLTDKQNRYNIEAEAKMSTINENSNSENGYSAEFEFGKVSGEHRYSVGYEFADTKYNINDLGLQFRNNYQNFSADYSYRIFETTEKLNSFNFSTWANYKRLYSPDTYTGSNVGFRASAQNKNLHSFGGNFNFEIGKQYDYFEPRTEGRFFIYENFLNGNFWISSNYNKKFAIDTNLGFNTLFEDGRELFNWRFRLAPRFRFNDHFLFIYRLNFNDNKGNRGYVTTLSTDEIIFGQRDQRTMINSITASYNFDSFNGLNLTFRNYWSTVTYDNQLYVLQQNGRLSDDAGYTVDDIDDPNVNFNTWNLDFSYTWQFAPGSQLVALYRNQLFNSDNESTDDYFNSMSTLFDQPTQHTISLKLIYFIDYIDAKAFFKKKAS